MRPSVRSSQGLTRCHGCRAHVHAADTPSATLCPFCDAPIVRAKRRLASSGRSALVAASLLAFTAGGCGGGDAADEQTTTESREDGTTGGEGGSDDADDVAGEGDAYDDEQGPSGPSPVALYGVAPDE